MNHLEENDITYTSHALRALKASAYSALASVTLFVHAFIPSLLKTKGSELIEKTKNVLDTPVITLEV